MRPAPAAGSDGVQAADLLALNDAPDYMSYLAAHAGASRPSGRIVLTSAQVSGEEGSRRVTGYLDARQEAVLTEEGGYVEYTFDVEEAGFYTITAKFCVPEGRHTAAERDILVNGELPYAEAAAVTFQTPLGQQRQHPAGHPRQRYPPHTGRRGGLAVPHPHRSVGIPRGAADLLL